jgi:hypothetical protein
VGRLTGQSKVEKYLLSKSKYEARMSRLFFLGRFFNTPGIARLLWRKTGKAQARAAMQSNRTPGNVERLAVQGAADPGCKPLSSRLDALESAFAGRIARQTL